LTRQRSARRKRSPAASLRRSLLQHQILLQYQQSLRQRLRRLRLILLSRSREVRERRSIEAVQETIAEETRVETAATTVRRKRLREKVKHKQGLWEKTNFENFVKMRPSGA
jgi:hypothetical protein